MSPTFEFTTKVDADDYISANRLVLRKRWLWKRLLLLLLAAWLLYSGFIIAFDEEGPDILVVAIALLSGLSWTAIMAAVLIPLTAFFASHRMKKQVADIQRIAPETSFRVSADGVQTDNAVTTNRLAWSQFKRWLENERVLVLMLSDFGMIVVPKRIAEAGAVDFLRSRLIAAGVPSR